MPFRWTGAKQAVYELAAKWEQEEQESSTLVRPYREIVTDLFFHADLRYHHYRPFPTDGEYSARLENWLNNTDDERQRRIMLRLAHHVFFIDRRQMSALYRTAFRERVVPIAEAAMGLGSLLSPDYPQALVTELNRFRFYCVTESFNIPEFVQGTGTPGLPRPRQLGMDPNLVASHLPTDWSNLRGVFVFEDFVSTGNQTRDVILELRSRVPNDKMVIFVPLIALDRADLTFGLLRQRDIDVAPVLRIAGGHRLTRDPEPNEHPDFAEFRPLIIQTGPRVLEQNGPTDDPPPSAFGYGETGGLFVTSHNTPDNTLPMIHHRAPSWVPLFRRHHHAEGT